ncbi:MAG: hypothetical protein VW707_04385 [Candidatus Puniceispirillum sp.]
MKWLLLALGSMFVQQSFVTIGKTLPAILAPAIFDDLLIDPSWLGVYVGIIAAVALTVQAGCGSFIVRYGSLRISQISLFLTGVGHRQARTFLAAIHHQTTPLWYFQ